MSTVRYLPRRWDANTFCRFCRAPVRTFGGGHKDRSWGYGVTHTIIIAPKLRGQGGLNHAHDCEFQR